MPYDIFNLSSKVAIVWGAGQGMGEETALILARAGCHVAVIDIVEERAISVAQKLRALGGVSLPLVADATDPEQVAEAFAKAEHELGPCDVMVTIVGMARTWKPLIEMTSQDWDADQEMNLKSLFFTAQAAARSFAENKLPGSIVAISSMAGVTSAPGHAAYGAAKAGIVNLVRSMACEFGPAVRVNAIAPGVIRTIRIIDSEALTARIRARVPLERMGTTQEIAKAALFLVSDLSSFITGQTIPVDGGWSAVNIFNLKDS